MTVFGVNSSSGGIGMQEFSSKQTCDSAGFIWITGFGATAAERDKRFGKDAIKYYCVKK